MTSHATQRFRQMLAALPSHVQNQAHAAYRIFRENPGHPGLHFKRVHDDPPIYSVRVGIGHRALGALSGTTIVWFWIGSHSDYDKLLRHL